jgi:uncharacterized protein (TIGR03435 family)
MLIQSAYDLKIWQISGGPGWVTTDHYDIEARAEGNPGLGEKLQMFRPLLADRFQLKFHRETRQMPIYSLGVAKNGPKLQATASGVRGYISAGRVQEQLGLKLEAGKGPIEVLVIDHVEKPSDN